MRPDHDIKQDVVAELEWDPQVDEAHVGVTVADGAVTLTGAVRTYASRRAAERAALRVRGVKAVAEDLKVDLLPEHVEDDSDLAKRIAHLLEWDAGVPHDKIQAEVRNGHVTLGGEVVWRFQRDVVEEKVERLRGVRSVVNNIRIAQPASAPAVKKEIVRALHRAADVEANRIEVAVDGSKVTLNGSIKAWHERELAEKAAWSSPGVTAVVDNLRLG